MNVLSEFITRLNEFLAPITPAGVQGVEFIAVFLMIYALMFILLERTKLFGENRAVRLLIALAGAYFTASSAFSVLLISKLFPHIGIVTMMLLAFIIVLSMFNVHFNDKVRNILLVLCIGFVVWGAWTATSSQLNFSGFTIPSFEGVDWYFIIFIIILLVILILIGTGGFGEGGKKLNIIEKLSKLFESD